jgi:hypothetical protein
LFKVSLANLSDLAFSFNGVRVGGIGLLGGMFWLRVLLGFLSWG